MNPPTVFPTDPHLLAQWRFDERRRRNGTGGVALHRVAMVLGRFSDRVEIRNPAEAPCVVESAQAIAVETDKPAYRAALLEVADRISAHFGEQRPAESGRPAAEDWLATLDAHLSGVPVAASGSSTHAPPTRFDPAPDADTGLPDFLAGVDWDAPESDAPSPDDGASEEPVADLPLLPTEPPADETVGETVDEALYIPPILGEEGAASDEPLEFLDTGAEAVGDVRDDARYEPRTEARRVPAVDADPGVLPRETTTPPASIPVFAVVTPAADESPSAQAHQAPTAALDEPVHAAARLAELGRTLGLAVSGRAVRDGGSASHPGDPLASLDVVWRDGTAVAAAFRITTGPPLAAALLDLADVLAETADAPPPLFLVGPAALRGDARTAASRPAFARLPVPLATGCGFLALESLRSALERAADFLPYLRPGFVRALAERLDD